MGCVPVEHGQLQAAAAADIHNSRSRQAATADEKPLDVVHEPGRLDLSASECGVEVIHLVDAVRADHWCAGPGAVLRAQRGQWFSHGKITHPSDRQPT